VRILFVDDMRDTRELFRMVLTLHGMETRLAEDGREAVSAVEEERFDAIIMDVEMPRMNGWDAVRTIRTLANGRRTPIIMFTAYGNDENHQRALDIGANDLWFKPLLPTEMISRLNAYLA
jgi:DNA-binding response OmpR family regulator